MMRVTRRRWITACVLLLVAAAAVRLASWQGLVAPVRVFGGSMAESLLGDHFYLTCDDCGFPCRYDAHAPPRDERVICPNCGAITLHPADGTAHRGQRVWIDRLVYWWRPPERWETVALRLSGSQGGLGVKRVVGLPGEVVEIRDGDLYVNGRLVRKSLAQLRSVAQLVHDNRYGSRHPAQQRWRPTNDSGGWQQVADGFHFRPVPEVADHPAERPANDLDWIAYHHWACFAGSVSRTEPSPILDNYGYNQRVSRQLHAARDVLLVARLMVSDRAGGLAFEVSDGSEAFGVVLDFDRRTTTLRRGSQPLDQRELPADAYRHGARIELALCDGQVLFAVDEQLVFREEYVRSDVAGETVELSAPRLRIGARGTLASVDRLQVFRDIYYLDPLATGRPWQVPQRLGAAEIFVVGDNVPISRDSRHGGPVPLQHVVGAVRTGWR
jgi:signal peptidase I